MEVNNFSTTMQIVALFVSCDSLCLAHILLLFLQESHGPVSFVAQGSFAGDGALSDPESHGSISSV